MPTKTTDYTAMGGPEMLKAMGDDASKWAAAFCQIAAKLGHDIDEGWMISWFAKAIEQSSDVRRWRREAATDADPSKATDWNKHGPRLYAALKSLTVGPGMHLGDLVYHVAEHEASGWDEVAVEHWHDAVVQVTVALAEAEADGAVIHG